MVKIMQKAVSYPAFPTVKSEPEHSVPLEKLKLFAEKYIRLIRGQNTALGPPIPLANGQGALSAYAIPFVQSMKGQPSFPENRTLFRELEALRSEHLPPDLPQVNPESAAMNFQQAVAQRLGQFGSIYLSATTQGFPFLGISYSLHPYYVHGVQAHEAACRSLKNQSPNLAIIYFLGPGQEYFEFSSPQEGHVLIHAHSLQVGTPDQVLGQQPSGPKPVALLQLIDQSWRQFDSLLTADRDFAERLNDQLKLIPNYECIPIVDWTYWCAPTALTMVLGFWDHYRQENGAMLGYGRLIDYWFNHPSAEWPTSGHNIPNLMHKLINPEIKNWAGEIEEMIKNTTGYRFAYQSHEGGPNNDWGWNELKAEIDQGRPLHWEIFSNHAGHAMAAFGYHTNTVTKNVVVYNTWGDNAGAQHEEWNYAVYKGDGPAVRTVINCVIPQTPASPDDLMLFSPHGEEIIYQWIPEEIRWGVWGDAITTVDLLLSVDAGNTWTAIASGIKVKPGQNAYVWYPSNVTAQRARIRIKGYNARGEYLAGDGSHYNFSIASSPLLQARGKIRTLKMGDHSLDTTAHPEASVILDSLPECALQLGLQRGLLTPARRRMLSILIDALEYHDSVALDYIQSVTLDKDQVVHADPSHGVILRIWLERS